MTKISVVLKAEPYSDETAYTGLKFAKTALAEGHEVDMFLLQGAIFVALKKQDPSHLVNHYKLLGEIIDGGGRVLCCGSCTKARGVTKEMLHEEVGIGTMPMLVEIVTNSERVVNF